MRALEYTGQNQNIRIKIYIFFIYYKGAEYKNVSTQWTWIFHTSD